jgi:hypothetical protein
MFTANGIQFSPPYSGELIATYDRLINEKGRLVGFQVWPTVASAPDIFDRLPDRPYLHSIPGSHFNIVLNASEELDAAGAGDQSLIGQIYHSTSGELAIAIDLAGLHLEPEDLEAIRASASN